MPATSGPLTSIMVNGRATLPTDGAACNECDVVLYRGFSMSEAKQFAAKHNAAVHGISKFGRASIHSAKGNDHE